MEYRKAETGDVEVLRDAARLLRHDTEIPQELAEIMAEMFERWAKMGALGADFLNRVGGKETLELARRVIARTR